MGMVVVTPAGSFHPQHHHEPLLSSAEHPIIPLLTAAPCIVDDDSASAVRSRPATGIQFWQPAQPQSHYHHHQQLSHNPNPNPSLSYLKKPVPTMVDASGILTAGVTGGSSSGGVGGASTCQDCGNQAKKDCIHRRCRTCCKSRGLDCSTHVKSTWVPAARRRERQHLAAEAAAAAGSSASTSAPKKPRLITSQTTTTTTTSHTSTSNTPPRSFDTSSSHLQDESYRDGLPGHVQAPAVFKCVRVTSIDDGEDEYAYHAMVKIGGHVFKGFLYDQGLDDNQATASTSDNTGINAIPNLSELNLGGGRNGSSPMLSSGAFGVGGAVTGGAGGLIGGTNLGK